MKHEKKTYPFLFKSNISQPFYPQLSVCFSKYVIVLEIQPNHKNRSHLAPQKPTCVFKEIRSYFPRVAEWRYVWRGENIADEGISRSVWEVKRRKGQLFPLPPRNDITLFPHVNHFKSEKFNFPQFELVPSWFCLLPLNGGRYDEGIVAFSWKIE